MRFRSEGGIIPTGLSYGFSRSRGRIYFFLFYPFLARYDEYWDFCSDNFLIGWLRLACLITTNPFTIKFRYIPDRKQDPVVLHTREYYEDNNLTVPKVDFA
jgi:hypothetical protein